MPEPVTPKIKQQQSGSRIIDFRTTLKAMDLYTLGILAVYTLIAIVLSPRLADPVRLLLLNAFFASGVLAIAYSARAAKSKFFFYLRRFYMVPLVYLMYDQVHRYIRHVNPQDYDELLIQWDYAIFGVHPTQWLSQHLAFPALTEYLQICYMLFYLLPIMHGVEMISRGRIATYDKFARTLTLGYYISYLLYFALPAIGPRFTLHDFALLDSDLPGLWLSSALRQIVNAGGGGAAGVNAADLVNRDCMPSGHTMMTLMNMLMAWRFRSRTRWIIYIFGASLIFSTVYLRYHYVVDVIAGIACALAVLWLEPRLYAGLKKKGFPKA